MGMTICKVYLTMVYACLFLIKYRKIHNSDICMIFLIITVMQSFVFFLFFYPMVLFVSETILTVVCGNQFNLFFL